MPTPTVLRVLMPYWNAVETIIVDLRAPTWIGRATVATNWSRRIVEAPRLAHIGARPIDTITTPDVFRVLMPYWNAKPESTNRVRHRLATRFRLYDCGGLLLREFRERRAPGGVAPASQRNRQHRPALPHVDMADCSEAIHEAPGRPLSKLALELLMVTAVLVE